MQLALRSTTSLQRLSAQCKSTQLYTSSEIATNILQLGQTHPLELLSTLLTSSLFRYVSNP